MEDKLLDELIASYKGDALLIGSKVMDDLRNDAFKDIIKSLMKH